MSKRVRVGITLSEADHEALRHIAKDSERSVSGEVRHAVRERIRTAQEAEQDRAFMDGIAS